MRALSIYPDWAMLMYEGEKTIEVRRWQTPYRGELLFCTTQVKIPDCISGHALFIATIADVQPFSWKHLDAACLDEMPSEPCFAWILKDLQYIHPFPVKGKQGFFHVDDTLIRRLPDDISDEEAERFVQTEFVPLLYHPSRR